jgi:hypothetical protein
MQIQSIHNHKTHKLVDATYPNVFVLDDLNNITPQKKNFHEN